MLSVGLFADSQLPGVDIQDGLFRSGFQDWSLLGYQTIAILSIMGWAASWSSIFFYVVGCSFSKSLKDPRTGLRVIAEEEERGADWYLHGVVDQEALEELAKKTDEDEDSFDDDVKAEYGHDPILRVSFDEKDNDDDDLNSLSFNSSSQVLEDQFDNDGAHEFNDVAMVTTTKKKETRHRKPLLTRKSDMYFRESIENEYKSPRKHRGGNVCFLDNTEQSRGDTGHDNEGDFSPQFTQPQRIGDFDGISSKISEEGSGDADAANEIEGQGEEEPTTAVSRTKSRAESSFSNTEPTANTTTTARAGTTLDSGNLMRRHYRGSNSFDRMLGQSSSRRMVSSSSRMLGTTSGRLSTSYRATSGDSSTTTTPSGRTSTHNTTTRPGIVRQKSSRNMSEELRIWR